MRPRIAGVGGRPIRFVLWLGVVCALVGAVGPAAESATKGDCGGRAGDGPAITIRQKNAPCAPSRIGNPRPEARRAKSPEDLPGAAVDDLLTRVRNFNPELAAAALDREAAVAKVYPAGALDDPMVNLSRDQGFRPTLLTLSQDFPLWGKREL